MAELDTAVLARTTGEGAVLRQGVVTQASPLLVRVGAATTAVPATALGSYVPIVGDVVSLLEQDGDRLVVGVPVATSTLAIATVTGSSSGISSVVDVAGLTVTFEAVAGRTYKLSTVGYLQSNVVDDVAGIQITDASNNQLQSAQVLCRPINTGISYSTWVPVTPGAGSVTYKVRVLRVSGTGGVGFFASSAAPALLIAEVLGP